MAKKTLQQQGVPFPAGLKGAHIGPPPGSGRQAQTPVIRSQRIRERTPIEGQMGGTRDTSTLYEYPREETGRRNRRGSGGLRNLNPSSAGASAGSGIGGLEAEFLFAIVLLVLFMFADNASSYGDKIMSFMKRGALTCLLFFILALLAATGPSMARISKALGAMIIIMLLITSPMNTVIKDVDSLIKNDWVGTSENAGTAGTGTAGATSPNTSNLGQDFLTALENEVKKQGQKGGTGVTTAVKNALDATLNGIIPGAGSLLSKLGF